jgi:hypothetical protein
LNALTRFYKARLPGPITEAIVWLQLNVVPSRFYRRRAAVLRLAGQPKTVVSGPFKGMVYARHAADKCLVPRLFGTYEKEIHGSVEKLCASQPDVVAIAGAGEGYYSVGLARRVPSATVYAYDGFCWAKYLLKQMAGRNNLLDRVKIGGLVDPAELERVLKPAKRPALVCDVDGYELVLLDLQVVPSLARTTILLELHDHLAPGLTEEIRRRFAATHKMELFHQRSRTMADLPPGLNVPENEALWVMNEMQFRGVEQSWLYMEPNAAGQPA